MRCQFILILSVAAASWILMSAGFSAAEDPGQPGTMPQASGELRILDNAAEAEASQPAKREGSPTPAKREPAAKPLPADPAASDTPSAPTAKPSAEAPKADESLTPIPDPMEAPPVAVEAASFKGITPGSSTKADVEESWGKPKDTTRADGFLVHLYEVEPFKQIEVNYAGEKVASIVIRLGRSFPADNVAKLLDLAAIRPVLISNETGEILGLAYPERGVLFAFERTEEPGKPSMKVLQIILEPLSAEAFVLRAETMLETRCDLSRSDLEQALKLEPDNARAHWLLGRALAAAERYEEAAAATGKAVRLEPDNPQYRATHAQVLAQSGLLLEAAQHAEKAVEQSGDRLHVKAKATCLLGDLLASGAKPDFKKALAYHTEAIRIADPLCGSPHPAVRLAAKEVLVDAHLGAAHDIAWGEYKEKGKAVVRWLERAKAAADDLVNNENGNPLKLFHVGVRSLSAYVGARGEVDPEPAVKTTIEAGDKLLASAREPARKAQLQWELGAALYDAVQVFQMRKENDKAMQTGRAAADYLAEANRANPSPAAALLLGRLYFRLGAIHALGDRDHKAAVVWFEKALPLLKDQSPDDLTDNLGRHGEALVSMGVSYWQTDQQEKAVELTEQGIKWMEQAVKQGHLDRSSLVVPYGNLAAMHRKLGNEDKAARLLNLAGRIKEEKTR